MNSDARPLAPRPASPAIPSARQAARLGVTDVWLILRALALGVLTGGCVTARQAELERWRGMEEGRQKALEQQSQQEPAVFFVGDVRNSRVPWQEGLTLADALAAAQYTWNWDPHLIKLTRRGEVHVIPARQLLRGTENPLLEAGDIIEVRH